MSYTPTWTPGRPPNVLDQVRTQNGSPQPLGVITSTGAAVNNSSTAAPFSATPQVAASGSSVNVPVNMLGTLAGKTLLVSATAAGFLLPATATTTGTTAVPTVASTATVPPAAGTFAGVPIQANECKTLEMLSTEGWLQFISSSGTASLWVWELA